MHVFKQQPRIIMIIAWTDYNWKIILIILNEYKFIANYHCEVERMYLI